MKSIQLLVVCGIFVVGHVLADHCITPNNETAECVPLANCPILLQSLKDQTPVNIYFVSQSFCGIWNSGTHFQVCCGTTPYFINNEITTIEPAETPIAATSPELPITILPTETHSTTTIRRTTTTTSTIRITRTRTITLAQTPSIVTTPITATSVTTMLKITPTTTQTPETRDRQIAITPTTTTATSTITTTTTTTKREPIPTAATTTTQTTTMMSSNSNPKITLSITIAATESPKTKPKRKPLSDRRFCGYQHTDDYNYAGNDTAIDEFPWLAVFKYKRHDDIVFEEGEETFQWGCSGSLINNRYVLTAAQCLLFPKHSLVAVRLGEYNIKHATDCVKYTDLDDCSNPIEDVGIERKIRHPRYVRKEGLNDIALLRLNRTITFSDYIRPICLPIGKIKLAEVNNTVLMSGFGRIETEGEMAIIKKRIVGRLISNEECKEKYSSIRVRNVNENIICSIETENTTSYACEGDSGGPLMFSRRNQWHIEGISVWSISICGGYLPFAHTKVVNYLDWIEETIQP